METAKRTPLFGLHRRLGARMTEFGGYEMPLNYPGGIIAEHLAVRSAAGLFDLSHMGEFELRGAGALALLERALTNSAARLQDGQAQYTLMGDETGGTVDDLIVYKRDDGYMLCVNAGNITGDYQWLRELDREVDFQDQSEQTALLAIQGPLAEKILERATKLLLPAIRRFHFSLGEMAGVRCMVARTGYTGEDGFEIFMRAEDAETAFLALLDLGAKDGLKPCGLGARDTLRMEAGLPLYGHELDRETSPLMARLARFVKFGHDFIGERALIRQRDQGVSRYLAGLRVDDGKSIARQGYKVFRDGQEVGVITSGTFAPSFRRPLALTYLNSDNGTPIPLGALLTVEIRRRAAAATVVELPFYRLQKKLVHA
ncbi:MAG: glycine cleavage system aminomethyltransferase GcvT [Candidatus Binataceae bacterium]